MPLMARVIGTLWATRKYPDLEGAKILLIQPLNCELEPTGKPFAAVDTVGAGLGELVFYVTAYEAVIPFWRPLVPIDASLVGIVERIDYYEGDYQASLEAEHYPPEFVDNLQKHRKIRRGSFP
jgi:ethanolamine utilization protein EutN